MKLARDPRKPESERIAMIELLGELGRDVDRPVLLGFLAPGASQQIQLAAVAALGQFQDAVSVSTAAGARRSGVPVVRDRDHRPAGLAARLGCVPWSTPSAAVTSPRAS